MKVDRGFRDNQDRSDLFAALAVADQGRHLHLLRCEHQVGVGHLLQERRNNVLEMGFDDLDQGALPRLKPGRLQFFQIGKDQSLDVGKNFALQFGLVLLALFQEHLEGNVGLFEAFLPFGDLLAAPAQGLFGQFQGGDVFVTDHHPDGVVSDHAYRPHVIPMFAVRCVAGVIVDELADPAGNYAADPGGDLDGIVGVIAVRMVANAKIVGAHGVDPFAGVVGVGKATPGLVGFQNNAVGIQDGDVGGKRVEHGAGQGVG